MRQKNIDKKYQIFQNLQSNKNLFLKPQEKFEFLSKNLENECLNFEKVRTCLELIKINCYQRV